MALKIIEKLTKSATKKIGKFDVQYNFEHASGEAAEVIRCTGQEADGSARVDAMYFPATSNFSTTFHNMAQNTDVSIVAEILKDMKGLAAGVNG